LQLANSIDPVSQARIASAQMFYGSGGHAKDFNPNP
jgi:hypothetical protein